MKIKTRIQLTHDAYLYDQKPVHVIARHAAEQLENFIIHHPEVIHDVTTVGDVTRNVSAYRIDLGVKDRHDPGA